MHPFPDLEVYGESAEFHVGEVPGGDDPPPMVGYVDEATLAERLAGWRSTFLPLHSSFFPRT